MPAAVTMSINLSQMVTSRTSFIQPSGDVTRPVSSAKRCLFEVDHEEIRRDLDAELRAHQERFKEKYNFDIRTDTPLEGRYEWVRVSSPSVAVEEAGATRSTTSNEPVENDASAPEVIESNVNAKGTRQTSIQTFFPLRKRRAHSQKRLTSDACKIRRSTETGTEH